MTNYFSILYGDSASIVYHNYSCPSIYTIPTDPETMREVIARLVLEYKYSQQLFVLVLRVHDVHGRGIGSGAGMQILGSADGLVHEGWPHRDDEYDHAVCDNHHR